MLHLEPLTCALCVHVPKLLAAVSGRQNRLQVQVPRPNVAQHSGQVAPMLRNIGAQLLDVFFFFLFFGYLFFSRGYITYIGAVRFFFFWSLFRINSAKSTISKIRPNVAQHWGHPRQCCATLLATRPMLFNKTAMSFFFPNVAQHWGPPRQCCATLVPRPGMLPNIGFIFWIFCLLAAMHFSEVFLRCPCFVFSVLVLGLAHLKTNTCHSNMLQQMPCSHK